MRATELEFNAKQVTRWIRRNLQEWRFHNWMYLSVGNLCYRMKD